METTVLSPQSAPLWSGGFNFQESLAQAEKVAENNQNADAPPPPRQVLQYLVRMGSFTSVPALREDSQDVDFQVPHHATRESLISRCLAELPLSSKPIPRHFVNVNIPSAPARLSNLPNGEEPAAEELLPSASLRRLSFISQGKSEKLAQKRLEYAFTAPEIQSVSRVLREMHTRAKEPLCNFQCHLGWCRDDLAVNRSAPIACVVFMSLGAV